MLSQLLAGDIGGTNTRLLLVAEGSRQPLWESSYPNRNFPNLAAIASQFLQEAAAKLEDSPVPDKACFAVAGPVNRENNTCTLTNLDWDLNGNRLAQDLGIGKVQLINDFEAVGYGVSQLEDSEREILQPGSGKSLSEAPLAVLGAGTGLGEAFVLLEKQGERAIEKVYPTEGGHADFAPCSEEEFALRQYIRDKYRLSRVSVERVVSGPGIVAIYQFLRDCQPFTEVAEVGEQVRAWEAAGRETSSAPAGIISQTAARGDALCTRTMELFAEAYGTEAGNFALKLLPYRGLYVAGGIAPKILQEGSWLRPFFLNKLTEKGRMRELVRQIPVYLVTNDHVGLIGAAHYAAIRL